MIRKSGNRFSEKIMLHQKNRAPNRFNLKPSRSSFLASVLARSLGNISWIFWQYLSAISLRKISWQARQKSGRLAALASQLTRSRSIVRNCANVAAL
jgi:hypothetical protein